MKKLPELNVSFEELYRMLAGPVKLKLLLTGIELGVFNQLSEPKSAEAVAKTIGTHPGNTRLFLDGLAASDLVVKKKGLYQNTPVTQAFLVESSPTFLGRMFTFSAQMWYAALNDLPKLIKEGPPSPSPEADMGAEEVWAQGAATAAKYELADLAQQAVEIVSQLPEFPSFKKMLDLGGGPGLVGIAMAREMAPIMAGIIMAGRTGAAFAAQLGTMTVNEEIDALSTLGISSMDFLVLPRMLALILMMPLLCLYADLLGILGGALVGIVDGGINPELYWSQTVGALSLRHVGVGVFKGAIFGILVALAGCLRGMQSGRSASAVGEAATSAVVTGIVAIIVTDAILAVVTSTLGI